MKQYQHYLEHKRDDMIAMNAVCNKIIYSQPFKEWSFYKNTEFPHSTVVVHPKHPGIAIVEDSMFGRDVWEVDHKDLETLGWQEQKDLSFADLEKGM